jgi:hypothetical protein
MFGRRRTFRSRFSVKKVSHNDERSDFCRDLSFEKLLRDLTVLHTHPEFSVKFSCINHWNDKNVSTGSLKKLLFQRCGPSALI